MKRDIEIELINWFNNKNSKPLIIFGARQVGKTYIINKLFNNENYNFYKYDLLENHNIKELFNNSSNYIETFKQL